MPTVALLALASACNESSKAPRAGDVLVRPAATWPEPRSVDLRAVASLKPEMREALARSVVPVLAPVGIALTSPVLIAEGEFYALSGRVEGATVSIQGTRAAHRYQGLAPVSGDRDLRGTKGFVTINEGIRSASWNEYGMAYSVDVECADAADPHCASEAFVLELTSSLAYAGGAGR